METQIRHQRFPTLILLLLMVSIICIKVEKLEGNGETKTLRSARVISTSPDLLAANTLPANGFKRNPNQANLNPGIEFSSYFGGSGYEQIRDIVLDADGNAYITGRTSSPDLPTTAGSFQMKYGGGTMDAFVAKITQDGSSLIWCTYLGGSIYDVGYGIALDKAGNVYVAGRTSSSDFPTTHGAFDKTYNGGHKKKPYFGGDIFVSKLTPDGSRLLYSTFIGGSNDDWARDLTVDPDTGSAYATGTTYSTDFPTTSGAFDRTHNKSIMDIFKRRRRSEAFVLKLSPDGASLVYSTYLGGSDYDGGQGIAVDTSGRAYATGGTASNDFPTTEGAYQRSLGGSEDVWVSKISPDGSSLVYSTFLGGSSNDGTEHSAIIVDNTGQAYVSGFTKSADFPTTKGAYQGTLKGPIDNFIAKLTADGKSLVFSTYFGGSNGWETAFGSPGLDNQENIYVSGGTACSDFPVTVDAYQSYNSGEVDIFLSKFSPDASQLLYSTFIGGIKGDHSRGLAVSKSGNIYIIGQISSKDIPITAASFQTEFKGNGDGYILKFEKIQLH